MLKTKITPLYERLSRDDKLQGGSNSINNQEKTLITDAPKKYIKFLGCGFNMVKGKAKRGCISRTIPDRDTLKRNVDDIAAEIKAIPECYSQEQLIGEINRINSISRRFPQSNTATSIPASLHAPLASGKNAK